MAIPAIALRVSTMTFARREFLIVHAGMVGGEQHEIVAGDSS